MSTWTRQRGGGAIINPLGKVLAGPDFDIETILYADIDLDHVVRASTTSTRRATIHGLTCSSSSSTTDQRLQYRRSAALKRKSEAEMFFEMGQLAADIRCKILTATVTPRPIAWVTTRSPDGVANAALFSFFNVLGHEPPTVVLGLLRHPEKVLKDTAENILATGEFVVHFVPRQMADAMNTTCVDAPPDVDELALAGLRTVPSRMVAPPRIADSPVAFECRSLSAHETGPRQVAVIGEVVCAHVADEFVLDAGKGYIDTLALDLVARMHGSGWYARPADLFQLVRPTRNNV